MAVKNKTGSRGDRKRAESASPLIVDTPVAHCVGFALREKCRKYMKMLVIYVALLLIVRSAAVLPNIPPCATHEVKDGVTIGATAMSSLKIRDPESCERVCCNLARINGRHAGSGHSLRLSNCSSNYRLRCGDVHTVRGREHSVQNLQMRR